MYIEKDNFIKEFDKIENDLKSYKLPSWDELPEIDLYMDQIIAVLTKYLGLYYEYLGEDKVLTPSMINNYVKLGTIPSPNKKKYSRVHIAYLVIVCTMKHTLDMATIQKIIPIGISEEEVRQTYNSFVFNQGKAFSYVTDKVRNVANPIFEKESDNQNRLNDLLMQMSVSANIFKVFTQRMTELEKEK